jgi:chromate reductase, NAD(P)H dehydrogenase (quinone)
VNVVAISGSLRARSSNSAMIRAVTGLAPEGMDITVYEGMGDLPHFNPDLDDEGASAPAAVAALRQVLASGEGFVISSPEYAHGVPGSLKNALDWIVSSGEFMGKPLVLINASPGGGQYAQAALVETLKTMDANVLVEASLTKPFLSRRLDGDSGLDTEAAIAVRGCLEALARAIAGG